MQWKLNNEKKKLMSECCNKLPFNPLCLESDSTLLLSLSALLHVQFSLAQAFIYFRGGGLVQWFHVLSFHNLVLEPTWLSLLVVCPDFLVSVPHLPVNEGASQVALVVKNPSAKAEVRDPGSIPGSARTPGGGHGNPRQSSCLENPMDKGVWRSTVYRVIKSWTRLKQLSTAQHTYK